jgi:hypothetical protein
MPNLETLDPSILYMLLKGEPGTRKSTAALSLPGPQYWFSFDKKMQSLLLPMRAWNIDPKTIEYDDYNDWSAASKKLEQLQLNCKYKTLIFDSITSIGDATNRQTIKAKSGTTSKDGSEKGLRVGGIPVNSLEDYKAEAAAFNELMAITKDISSYHHCNIVLIAHVIGEKKEQTSTGTHFARIIVTGGKIISAKIPAYCQEVYHFDITSEMDASKGGKYGLVTEHTGDDFARTSLPLPRRIEFGNNPLYATYLKPAIEQLKNKG